GCPFGLFAARRSAIPAAVKLAALSVDLDEIPCYHAIYGLPPPVDATASAVYRRAVPRYRELLASLGVPCTFFVIGRDMDDEAARVQARALAAAGHELGNHTRNHRYDLVRIGDDAMRAEVSGGIKAITAATGVAPRGFRAPGYTITDELFDVLSELGVTYDSSVFPCPAYYGAKVGAIGVISLQGRRSRSIVDTPAMLRAPADPYRVGRPYWSRGLKGPGMLELPIGVTRGLRLPYISTTVMLAGPSRAQWLTRTMLGRPLVNLELHGTDLLGAKEDGLEALAAHARDLTVSVDRKIETLRVTVRQLQAAGYRFVTLLEAAGAFAER
ncbi:MAG: polysaccharide deacetylase family protein, partial [Deltaproteobacteria bacterium]